MFQKIANFGFALKNLPKNMYYTYIINNDQLPDLIHDHVILVVHLVPQDDCNCFQNSDIWVCLENCPINTYHMQIIKIYQLPDLIHDHVDLDVHLDPQGGLESL